MVREYDNSVITEIKNVFAPFYEKVITENLKINKLREQLLKNDINFFMFHAMSHSAIDTYSSLGTEKNEQ